MSKFDYSELPEKQEQYQERHQEDVQEQVEKKETGGKRCPSCSYINEPDAAFCVECGSGFDTAERKCPLCGKMNTGLYCTLCGSSLEEHFCSNCSEMKYGDFCTDCGKALVEFLQEAEMEMKQTREVEIMSEQDAAAIIAHHQNLLSTAVIKELENAKDKMMVLESMENYRKLEERVREYNASQFKCTRTMTPEEQDKMRGIVARLQGLVAREKNRVDELIEEREERKERERQQELERLRLEKDRKERERYEQRVEGTWVSISDTWVETMNLNLSGNTLTGSSHWIALDSGGRRECVYTLEGTWDGNNFSFHSTKLRNMKGRSGHFSYCGGVNDSGSVLKGYFIDYRNEKIGQLFVKQ